jgi:hypothetical protein
MTTKRNARPLPAARQHPTARTGALRPRAALDVRLTVVALAVALAAAWLISAAPAARAQEPAREVYVQVILDASGSMAQRIGDETRMQIAKRVLERVVEAIPEREGVNVGFRIYGHRGDNTAAGRDVSCRSSELLVPMEGLDKPAILDAVADAEPTGWTPLAWSLELAGRDFPPAAEGVRNAVVLVTDGLETCGGDPCAVAASLNAADVALTTHVVGFALEPEEQQILECIAEGGEGMLLGAQDADELTTALFTILEELEIVSLTGFLEIEAFGDVWPAATAVCRGFATDTDPGGATTTVRLVETNRAELPVGPCEVTWANPAGTTTRVQVDIEPDRVTWLRGSLIEFPQGAGEIYTVADQAGLVVWEDQLEAFDRVWVLPGIWRIDLLERVGVPVLISADLQTYPGTIVRLQVATEP